MEIKTKYEPTDEVVEGSSNTQRYEWECHLDPAEAEAECPILKTQWRRGLQIEVSKSKVGVVAREGPSRREVMVQPVWRTNLVNVVYKLPPTLLCRE